MTGSRYVRVGLSWVDPGEVSAVSLSPVTPIRLKLRSGAEVHTGIQSTEDNLAAVMTALLIPERSEDD